MEELLEILKSLHPEVDYETEDKLVDDKILDSFDIVTLMSEIWEHFGVEILAEHLEAKNFNSAQAIYNLIEELEDLCNYSSIQATKIINSLPQVIIETISYDTAKHIKDVLSEIGAYVSLKTEKCNILVEIEPDSPDYQYFGIKVLNTENAPQHIKTLLLNARLLNQNVTKIEYKDIIASGLPFDKAETFVEYLKKNNVLCTIFKDTFNNSLNTSMIEFIVNHSIQDNLVHCPRCGSTQITTGQRGFSFWTGFIGANKTVNRCANCGHHWTP